MGAAHRGGRRHRGQQQHECEAGRDRLEEDADHPVERAHVALDDGEQLDLVALVERALRQRGLTVASKSAVVATSRKLREAIVQGLVDVGIVIKAALTTIQAALAAIQAALATIQAGPAAIHAGPAAIQARLAAI